MGSPAPAAVPTLCAGNACQGGLAHHAAAAREAPSDRLHTLLVGRQVPTKPSRATFLGGFCAAADGPAGLRVCSKRKVACQNATGETGRGKGLQVSTTALALACHPELHWPQGRSASSLLQKLSFFASHPGLRWPLVASTAGFWQGIKPGGQLTEQQQLDQLRELARRGQLVWGWPAYRATDELWVPLQDAAGKSAGGWEGSGAGRGAVLCAQRDGCRGVRLLGGVRAAWWC